MLSVDGSTPNGAFSLDGGGDGAAAGPLGTALQTKDTLFQLTEITGIIDCGETAPPVGGGNTPEATLSRGQNPNCTPLPYLLRTDPDNSVLLQKDASSQPGANFLLDITWEPEDAVLPVPATTIDYDGDGPNPPQTVQLVPRDDGQPDLAGRPEVVPRQAEHRAGQRRPDAGQRALLRGRRSPLGPLALVSPLPPRAGRRGVPRSPAR